MTEETRNEWLERVEALIAEVMRLRVAIWARQWADGKHPDAPKKPERNE